MATTRTITNAWENRYVPDIFYEEPEPPVGRLTHRSQLLAGGHSVHAV